jgi:glycosyltransferase involved in cell wall biosynthesis
MSATATPAFSIIILTMNEERNLPACLASLEGLPAEVWVVDSGSTDQTCALARAWGAQVVEHPFENYSVQRNWALRHLPLRTEWVLQLDADHRLMQALHTELQQLFQAGVPTDVNGYMVSRRTMFMGKWIRYGGHYPVYHAVLFRKDKGHCEEKRYDQHFKVEGRLVRLKGDIIDVITDSLNTFTERHNRWSSLEAEDQFSGAYRGHAGVIEGRAAGNPIQQRRFMKSVYEGFPLFVRPFLYFIWRYIFRLGFLDGRRGLIFHFLQGFWFRFLVDAKVYEKRAGSGK